ncbi:hypothetical protein KSP35_05430 [Aquihabitans sp. G128]|uniref:hypothetical protein n=1 Tax=Aquihabitans sp. G128 TaxID=2849779 RepID=UPI001C21624F|nr:hypothetical protein [Aquihabitans sp. G128]QXC62250.1 hypothetical protein KSP35_05430 [Aquihabitans sp. G128]
MQRVSVVGNAGSGKSSLARRIAAVIDAPCIELDAIHHLAGWQSIDPDEFVDRVDAITHAERWVVDGNYRTVVVDGPVWARADTVVWLDLPRSAVMRQVIGRTLRRTVRRERLWNGNREPLTNFWVWHPESIIRWAWTQHDKYEDRYSRSMASPALDHLEFVRLRSHAEADEWLENLSPRQ